MLKDLKNTARHSIIYSIGNISAKLVGLVLLPLYTTYLTTAEYGILALFEVTILLSVGVFSLRLSTSMMRWCSSEPTHERQKVIISSTLLAILAIMSCFFLLTIPFTDSISRFLFSIEDNSVFVRLLIVIIGLELINKPVIDLIRLREKSVLFVTVTLVKFVVVLAFNIYFVAFQGLGIKGVLISQLIGNVLQVLFSLAIVIKELTVKVSFPLLKEMISYGFPLIFSGVSMVLLTTADRYLIKYFLEYADLGIYSLGYKIASVLNVFVIQSYQLGFLPIAYKKYDEGNAERFFQKTFTYFVFLMVFIGLGISVFSLEVIELFSKNTDFLIAYKVTPLIVLGFVFRGIQYNLSLSFHFTRKTKYNAYIVVVGLATNILLNILLIPVFNIYGAALATATSWMIISALFYVFSTRAYFVKYEWFRIAILLIIGILLYFGSVYLNSFDFAFRLLSKTIVVISFPVILLLVRFYEKIELQRIAGFYQKWKNPSDWKKNLKNR